MLEYAIAATRIDGNGSTAMAREATVTLDTSLAGRPDALNPAELLLAAVAACMIKGVERVAPMLKFGFSGVEVIVHGTRQDSPPKMEAISYQLIIDTDETDQRLKLLHKNVLKYGTVSNTLAACVRFEGVIERRI